MGNSLLDITFVTTDSSPEPFTGQYTKSYEENKGWLGATSMI